VANCDRCGGALSECACLQVVAGSEECLRCGQGQPLPHEGTTRPVPHKDGECLATLLAENERLRRWVVRSFCGCVALDCSVHGAYDPADSDGIFALVDEDLDRYERDVKKGGA
jgi:hypothetical protein